MRPGTVVSSLLLVALLGACSDRNRLPTESAAGPPPAEFDISPTQGPPGTVARLTGIRLDADDRDSIAVWIGDEVAAITFEESEILAAFPLFLGPGAWPQPPAEAQRVEVRRGEEVLWRARQTVTITEMPRAPGTTAEVQTALERITDSYEALLMELPFQHEYEAATRAAVLGTLRGLVSEGEHSLAAVLSGTSTLLHHSPEHLDLLDALLATTGAVEFMRELADNLSDGEAALRHSSLGSTTLSDATTAGLFVGCRGSGEDFALACRMQIYEVLADLSAYFVSPTARTWANTVGLAAGTIALSGIRVPAAGIVGAILTVMDFTMSKVVPGLFPANIESFELSLEEDAIGVGELTSSRIEISAVNDPPIMTVSEIINLAVTVLGLRGESELVGSFREFLMNASQYTIEIFNRILHDQIDRQGLSPIDGFSGVPSMSWGPVEIRSADLVELFSFDAGIIVGDEDALEWRGVQRGETTIQARTRGAGERSRVLNCFACAYYGGAFGNDVVATASVPVTIGLNGTLDLTISGLPDGVAADVMIMGPEDYQRAVTESILLEELLPGTYTISALEVEDAEGTAFVPDEDVRTVEVDGRDVTSVTVEYDHKYGSLFLVISDLPDGVEADVTVSGPDYEEMVTDTELLDELEAGDYTITAHPVTDDDGNTYHPKPEEETVTVVGGETATVTVRYSPGLAFHLISVGPFEVRSDTWIRDVQADSDRERLDADLNARQFQVPGCEPPTGPRYYYELGNSEISSEASVDGQSALSEFAIDTDAEEKEIEISWSLRADASRIARPGGGADPFHVSGATASMNSGLRDRYSRHSVWIRPQPNERYELELVGEYHAPHGDSSWRTGLYYSVSHDCRPSVWEEDLWDYYDLDPDRPREDTVTRRIPITWSRTGTYVHFRTTALISAACDGDGVCSPGGRLEGSFTIRLIPVEDE